MKSRMKGTVFRRDDEPELVAVLTALVEEGRTIGDIGLWSIELAWFALWRHTIALDVVEMGTSRSEIARLEPCEPRLDDDAALATGIEACRSQRSKGTATSKARA
jgi:hypothetical protein